MSQLPTVSVVIPAYNYERYIVEALDSVILQDYPLELFDVIVVDDSSTDDTAAVAREYSARYPDQIRVVTQENGGPMTALNHGVALARGEYVTFLDADDAWLPQKTIRQVTAALEGSNVSMVACNMTIVDGDGVANGDTVNDRFTEPPGTSFAEIFIDNCALSTSMLFPRTGYEPIPGRLNYMDWWLMLSAALRGNVIYVDQELARYRVHGANRGASWRYNPSPQGALRDVRRALELKLTVLRTFDLSLLTPIDAVRAWDSVERHHADAVNACQTGFVDTVVLPVTEAEREQAQAFVAEADRARDDGDPARETLLMLRALGWNPFEVTARMRIIGAARHAVEAEQAPHPLAAAEGAVVLAGIDDLVRDEALLSTYLEVMAGVPGITLAIDATHFDEAGVAAALAYLDSRAALSMRDDIDVLALNEPLEPAQRHRMFRDARAIYRSDPPAADDPLHGRVCTPATLAELRDAIVRGQ
jgi:glycosyltransferase involved in cell wall biosynthesis